MKTHQMIFSGFGGQGIMLMGQILTQAGLEDGHQVSWIPSYGPEMRGGTAYCSVVVSDDPIGSPVVSAPTLVLAMNLPSKDRFEPALAPGGHLIINSSLVPEAPARSDIHNHLLPMNEITGRLNNPKVLNMVALGAIYAAAKPVSEEAVFKAMAVLFGKKFADKPQLVELNRQAFRAGCEGILNQAVAPA